jgi:hypothetical protein
MKNNKTHYPSSSTEQLSKKTKTNSPLSPCNSPSDQYEPSMHGLLKTQAH